MNDSTLPHEVIVQSWRSAFGDSQVTYLSGPITTGPRYLKWYVENEGGKKPNSVPEAEAVIRPNSKELIAIATVLRKFWPTPIVEPASFHIREWKQEEYLSLWSEFIQNHSETIVFVPSWDSSVGCITEFTRAIEHGKRTVTLDGSPLSIETAIRQSNKSLHEIKQLRDPPSKNIERLENAIIELEKVGRPRMSIVGGSPTKDESLDMLSEQINVAQFVSFRPEKTVFRQSFLRISGFSANQKFSSPRASIEALLQNSGEGSLNVRSYVPGDSQSREFIQNIRSVDQALSEIQRLSDQGLWTIANESIDVSDGGVSGVLSGGAIEFSPDDTPRAVEKSGICSLPTGMGMRILETVYRFPPDLVFPRNGRLEFSLHPKKSGYRQRHTIGWEFSPETCQQSPVDVKWPNRFSQHIGDKAFGLLVAHELGLNVPRSNVISRRVAPFLFGTATGSNEVWTRTAPRIQNPGEFTTVNGWVDPYLLMAKEDANASSIASIIVQDAVSAEFSGASLRLANGEIDTEGVKGSGEDFMLGRASPTNLPDEIISQIFEIHAACEVIGGVRFEWVYDGTRVWVVQLHGGTTSSTRTEIFPGEVNEYRTFDPQQGLPAFKEFLKTLPDDVGVILTARIGLTSHFSDVLRRDRRPSKFAD